MNPSRYPNQIVAVDWCAKTANADSTRSSNGTLERSIHSGFRGTGTV